jgi:hypothetical protein
MKIRTTPAFLFAHAIFLFACSTEPQRPEPPEGFFATYIEDDGLKKFQYTFDLPESKAKGGNQRPGNMQGQVSGGSASGVKGGVTAGTNSRSKTVPSGRGGSSGNQVLTKQLENQLERELSQSGFCRTGHSETERNLQPPTIYIRGECTEQATDDDRANFPNGID